MVSNAARKGAKKMPREMKEKVLELLDVLESNLFLLTIMI